MAEVSSVFKEIEEALQSDGSLAKGVEAVYQFQLDGDESNVYQLNLQGENSVTSEGAKDEADCTLKMSSDDFVKMTEGELNGKIGRASCRERVESAVGGVTWRQSSINR